MFGGGEYGIYAATETVIAAIVLKPHFIIFTPTLRVYNDGGPSQIATTQCTPVHTIHYARSIPASHRTILLPSKRRRPIVTEFSAENVNQSIASLPILYKNVKIIFLIGSRTRIKNTQQLYIFIGIFIANL